MEQKELIPAIVKLCKEHDYNEAIKLTSLISDKAIGAKAHLLCIKHEIAYLKPQTTGE